MPLPDTSFWTAVGSGTAQIVLAFMLGITLVLSTIIIVTMWKYILKQHDKQEASQKETNLDNEKRRDLANAQAAAYDKVADNVRDLERTIYERLPHVAR